MKHLAIALFAAFCASSCAGAASLQGAFLRTTAAREGFGITTLTPAKDTSRFLCRGRVSSVTTTPDGWWLIGKGLSGSPMRCFVRRAGLASGSMLLTVSGLQLDAIGSQGTKNGVSLATLSAVTGLPPRIRSFVALTPPSAAYLVDLLYSEAYWRPQYAQIRDRAAALAVADMGVNLGLETQRAMVSQALQACGLRYKPSDTFLSPAELALINACRPSRFRAGLAAAARRHYVWLATRWPGRYAGDLRGWLSRANSYALAPAPDHHTLAR